MNGQPCLDPGFRDRLGQGEVVRSFGSDNHGGVHPRVLEKMMQANQGAAPAYGDDPWTNEAEEKIRGLLKAPQDARVFLTLNGTGTNVLALKSVLSPWQGVIAADSAHIQTDETGAPEAAGIKVLTVPHRQGKLLPEDILSFSHFLGNPHHIQPGAVSISQTTEWGTAYTPQEIKDLADAAHSLGLVLHLDGARLSNAAAFLGCSLHDFTHSVDILSLGMTKNGGMSAEALVVLNPDLGGGLPFLRKQNLQLSSKMRYNAAQFLALVEGDLWLENARRANNTASLLAKGLQSLGFEPVAAVEGNAIFVGLPKETGEVLRQEFHFYWWDESLYLARLMTSWATTEADVEVFLERLRKLL